MAKKKIAFLVCEAVLFFVPFEAISTARAAEDFSLLLSSEAIPENSIFDPEPTDFEPKLSSKDIAFEVISKDWSFDEDWSFDKENPIDGLVRSVLRASPNFFDSASHGLEGNYVVLREESGNIEAGGKICRVRLIALRKNDGLYDRSLVLEVSAPDEEPFLIPLPEDLKGFKSTFEMKNFVSAYKSEILLFVKDVNDEMRRLLIIELQGKEGKILFDSKLTNIPTIMGRFSDGFRAEIFVRETGDRALIDLSSRKEVYETRLIYIKDFGTLRSPVTVWKDRYSVLQPVDVDGDGIYEIRGVVDLVGVGRSDHVAYVEFTLRYIGVEWRILDIWISPAEDLANLPMPRRIN
ncbi:MAG: hypothetical protein LBJ36_06265 [Synergistaceae bacterium]|jgi:hypothetical protein|nr:hypothetical protein [Synergistaceae bacterium]